MDEPLRWASVLSLGWQGTGPPSITGRAFRAERLLPVASAWLANALANDWESTCK
jgi:hypothetical protein